MRLLLACTLTAIAVSTSFLRAEDAKPVEGSLFVNGKTMSLKYAVAYPVKSDDGPQTTVFASDRRISIDEIKKGLAENDGNDSNLFIDQPFVKVSFDKDGKPFWFSSSFNGTSSGSSSGSGELKISGDRAKGFAKVEKSGDPPFVRAIDLKFDLPLGLSPPAKPATTVASEPVKPSVAGTFKGNGKLAKLAYVSARRGEPFADMPSILLVITEKDHLKDPKPDFNAGFGRYGSALVISMHENGKIFGCEIAHAAHGQGAFSSVGTVTVEDFDFGDGKVAGRITSNGEQKFFDKVWDVDVTFTAPFTAPAEKPVAESKPIASKPKEAPKSKPAKPSKMPEESAGAPVGSIAVADLPFLKNAKDVQLKEIVGMMDFKSDTGVTTLAAEMQKSLAAQGWKGDGADLVNANSTILRRKRGAAELTIFIKPGGKGSEVKVMSEGLDWSRKDVK